VDIAEVVRRADANYALAWSLFATSNPRGEVMQREGMTLVAAGVDVEMFNNAIVTAPLSDAECSIRAAVEFFDARRVPFVVRIRDGLDAGAERACEALGLPYSDSVPAMALREIPTRGRGVDGLEIRSGADAQTRNDHRDVVERGFEMDRALVDALLTERFFDTLDAEFFVGYLDGRPVATSALVASHRTAGVYNVATDPAFRGRGIGEAMTWHAVLRGAERGCGMASLQASEMGQPVYERMGFRLVASYRTFHRPEE
jgi:ribosomal protein S18 acetylase RimI-like enzyme